jgi:hypothetical protein
MQSPKSPCNVLDLFRELQPVSGRKELSVLKLYHHFAQGAASITLLLGFLEHWPFEPIQIIG